VKRLVALVLAVAAVASCSSAQEPEIAPSSGGGSVTTSRSLQPCPPGGPDETTPAAGCLDEDGNVVRS
jgi:hypothetical protein